VDADVNLRILEMLVDGVPPVTIVDSINQAGLDIREAILAIGAFGPKLRESARRREACKDHAYWMAGVRRGLDKWPRTIPCVTTMEAAHFYREYYAVNRPIFFETVTDDASPFAWSFERIQREMGEHIVEVMRNRAGGKPDYIDPQDHRSLLPLSEFVDEIQSVETNDVYLTAYNHGIVGPLGDVLSDFFPLNHLMDQKNAMDASLWMGPKGAMSPLHYDKTNVVIVQLLGTKRVVLLAPYEERFLYHDDTTLTSPINPCAPDIKAFPSFRFAKSSEIVLTEGSALFVPVGWWHFVESLAPSLSLSMSNFCAPNYFPASLF